MKLGRSELQVSRLGIGTLQWGDPGSGFGTTFGEAELASAFDEITAGGINFFDTAEVYGYQNIKSGTSEQLLGKFLRDRKNQGPQPVIATKISPSLGQTSSSILMTAGTHPLQKDTANQLVSVIVRLNTLLGGQGTQGKVKPALHPAVRYAILLLIISFVGSMITGAHGELHNEAGIPSCTCAAPHVWEIRDYALQSWDDFLVAREEILLEASRIVVRNDPEPDSEKSFSDGAEMVEKPVVHSSPESDDLPPAQADQNPRNPRGVSIDTNSPAAQAPVLRQEAWAASEYPGNSLAHRPASLSRVGEKSREPESPRNRYVGQPEPSPGGRYGSNSQPASPRKGGSSSILGVGSKLLSRIKNSKR